MRSVGHAALFIAAARGYFKAEGIELDMTAYASDADVVKVMAAGAADFGLMKWGAPVFALAGQGTFKAVAAQLREKESHEGNQFVVSNSAYDRNIRKLEHLPRMVVAIDQLGTVTHYQLAQAALARGIDLRSMTIKLHGTAAASAQAVASGKADIAVLSQAEARNVLTSGQGKLMAWCSEAGEAELGALFASAKMISDRRAVVEKFVRAYRRGAADYFTAFLRRDRYGKRISNAQTQEAAVAVARYAFPRLRLADAVLAVENEIYYMDAQARIDASDLAKQVTWYQAQGLLDKSVDARNVVDLSFK